MVLCDNLITIICNWNQNFEILDLKNVAILNEVLLDLCHHPSLHTLNLSGCCLHKHLTKDGLISFARKIKEEQNNNNRIRSMLQSDGYYNEVTDQVLYYCRCSFIIIMNTCNEITFICTKKSLIVL